MFWSDHPGEDYIGFFSYMSNATVKNLGIEMDATNGYIKNDGGGIIGKNYIGGIAGRAENSHIENCYIAGNVTANGAASGLVGQAISSDVVNCFSIAGPTIESEDVGYAAKSHQFFITGNPTVTKSSGNDALTWNDSAKKLELAAGLSVGVYPVVLTASLGALNTTHRFTQRIKEVGTTAPVITGPLTMTLTEGYESTSTDAFDITGTLPITITKIAGIGNITWNDTTKKLDIAEGLPADSYIAILLPSNENGNGDSLTFTLTVEKNLIVNPPKSGGGSGCNTGCLALALFLVAASVRKTIRNS